ncbi:MAG: hypothetical protein IH898_13370 [Planctomycetes bacterium]|nr:hypothetical protein [Planctomycetota bacterium]
MSSQFTTAQLEAFLDESLPDEQMTAVEAALRDDPELVERLSSLVGRRDAGVHTVGAIWRRHRLSCPTREQLGSFILEVLPEKHAQYVRFHLEAIGCRYCNASLEDLRQQHAATDLDDSRTRRQKYFQTSAGYLSRDQ